MKPLLSSKITRERTRIGDWISAKDQDTLDGLADFRARQEARRIQAQGKIAPVIKIRSIKP